MHMTQRFEMISAEGSWAFARSSIPPSARRSAGHRQMGSAFSSSLSRRVQSLCTTWIRARTSAFMEHFDPNAVFSSIDTSGRYAYGNQPAIAQWNLARLADALLPLIDADAESAAQRAGAAVEAFAERFDFHWTSVLRLKLGLDGSGGDDRALADDYLTLLSQYRIDFTLAFARLADAAQGNDTPLRALFGGADAALELWLKRWRERTHAVGTDLD